MSYPPAETKTIMQKLIERSHIYAQNHAPTMTFSEGKALPEGSMPKVNVIISCCDPRCLPEEFFMLEKGFEYSIVRNAGGRANEALRSIICMDTLLGVQSVIVVHHTDCGLTHLTDTSIRASLLAKDPSLESSISNMEFGEITDIPAAVLEDVAFLRDSPLIDDSIPIYGCVYDIGSGLVSEVV
ncbi:carbonic anhydrase [Rhexocercosporidium sp. MPI-PUGE-AT-0058]|nr:carbonic anhydrase [Rhexocercosporidium sp. MPI-PUGE-AT-0058]